MNFQEKIDQLQSKIATTLRPLIGGKEVVLLDVPHHDNIGDTLIWQGEIDLLKRLSCKILRVSSCVSWRGHHCLRPEVVILLHGGGNFGDLWPDFHEFKLKIIQEYPDNRIVMFPQSVWYDDKDKIARDAAIFAAHKDLTLCARDRWSYEFMKEHFPATRIMLLPDMAFCIDDTHLDRFRNRSENRRLYMRRIDKERSSVTPNGIDAGSEIHDWPTVEHTPARFWWLYKSLGVAKRLKFMPAISTGICKCVEMLAEHNIKDYLIQRGCEFLAPYSHVTTTRLHAMILSILLHKQVEYIDNTTGKLSAFADTWLSDLEAVKHYER